VAADFNELVAAVAVASAKCERAAGLVREAEDAHADAAADLAAAETNLRRAVDAERAAVAPVLREPKQIEIVGPLTRDAIAESAQRRMFSFRRRCSLCRGIGHDLRNCPEVESSDPQRREISSVER
jgi:hypothetical protein